MDLSKMKAEGVLARLVAALRTERHAQAEVLLCLAEVQRRRLFAQSGHTSLWDFCVRKLGLQKGATFQRVTAVELMGRAPGVIGYLRDGRVSMSALVLLRNVLTAENAAEWLERISGKSCEEIELMVGERRPLPARTDGIRKLPPQIIPKKSDPAAEHAIRGAAGFFDGAATNAQPPMDVEERPTPAAANADYESVAIGSTSRAPQEETECAKPAAMPGPASDDRYRLTLTVDARFKALLDEAAALSSHTIPREDPAAVLLLALDDLVVKLRKRRGIGCTPRPKRAAPLATETIEAAVRPPATKRAAVPAEVSRQIWKRDNARCVWPMPGGERCGKTWQLQIDHIVPVARGGRSSVENGRLLCAGHNQQAARDTFGDDHMNRFSRRAASSDVGTSEPPKISRGAK